jgi:magnesium transporter
MNDILTEISSLIEEKKWKALKEKINLIDPFEIGELIEECSESDDIILFRLLNPEQAKDTFHYLTYEKQEKIVTGLAQNVNKITNLLNDLEPDDRTAFLEELPGEIAKKLLQLLSREERAIATQLLGYPEDSIGRLMTTEYIAVESSFTVEQVMAFLRKFGDDSETLNVIYVVDQSGKLVDDLRLKEIILTDPQSSIQEIMDNNFVALNVLDDQEIAIGTFKDYDRVALPVIDADGILLGILTFDDIMDVQEAESTEDFHKFGSFQEAIANPLKARISYLYKQRIFWLAALVFMNVFSGAAISSFEHIIQKVVSLIFFLPLLIGSGGNAGAQSATLMIRSLAIGDVEIKDWFRLLSKEILVSFFLGLTMALGVALIASFRAPEIIIVVSLTMVLTVMTGSLVGLILPFIFTKFKLDPATASAPLITSIADICGVLIYFSIATKYFGV